MPLRPGRVLLILVTATAPPGLSTHVVERIVGRWTEAPLHVPSKGVPDGPLLGNGRFGAAVTWAPQNDDLEVSFHFGHNAFFAAPTNGISCCGYAKDGGGRKALGGLALRFPGVKSSNTVAEQRPSNATVVVTLQTNGGAVVVIEAYLHAERDMLVVQVDSTTPSLSVETTLWTYCGCSGERKGITGAPRSVVGGQNVYLACTPMTDRLHTDASASWQNLSVSRANGWPHQTKSFNVEWFQLVTKVEPSFTEAVVVANCDFGEQQRGPCASGLLKLSSAGALITVDLARRFLMGDYRSDSQKLPDHNMAELASTHLAAWNTFWNKSSIEMVSSPVTEFFWYMSLYLLRSSSAGDAAPGLFGVWVTDDDVDWLGDLTLNYNAEAAYYGAASSNHLDVFEPYFATILDYIPAAKRYAQEEAPECKGALYFPGHILPYGVTTSGKGDMGQRQMGLFATVPFVLFWRYTRDLSFAKRALPLFLGVSAYWKCVLTIGSDGWLHDDFDCAEELCLPDGNVQPDPAIVLSLLPALFQTLAEMTVALDVPEKEYAKQWQTIATNIAPYPTAADHGVQVITDFLGGDGVPVAWSGLFAAFPLGDAGPFSNRGTLKLARDSLSRFFRVWPGGKQGNSFVHAFPAAARIGWEPAQLFQYWHDYLLNTTDLECRMFPNGLVVGCGRTGFENVGGTSYVSEMLLQSHDGVLNVFPTLPAGVAASFHRLRAVGGFLVSAERCAKGIISGVVIQAPAITSDSGGPVALPQQLVLRNPWASLSWGVSVNGRAIVVDQGLVRFPIQPASTYAIEPDMSQSVAAPTSELGHADDRRGVAFREVHRDMECDRDVPGAPAAFYSLGGGGHSFEDCQQRCSGAQDCRYVVFFHETGYCHMYAKCDGGTLRRDGGPIIYARV